MRWPRLFELRVAFAKNMLRKYEGIGTLLHLGSGKQYRRYRVLCEEAKDIYGKKGLRLRAMSMKRELLDL